MFGQFKASRGSLIYFVWLRIPSKGVIFDQAKTSYVRVLFCGHVKILLGRF